MLGARDDIDAHLIRRCNIASFAIRVCETAALLPILRGSLRVKNIRVGLRPFQYAVSSTRLCILQDIVGVGEKLRLKLVRVLLRRCDRTGEFVIQKQRPPPATWGAMASNTLRRDSSSLKP